MSVTTDYLAATHSPTPQPTPHMPLPNPLALPDNISHLPRHNPGPNYLPPTLPNPAPKKLFDMVAPSVAFAKKRAVNTQKKPDKEADFQLSDENKLFIRTQITAGKPRAEIAHMIVGNRLHLLDGAKRAIKNFMEQPEVEIAGWWKKEEGRKPGTIVLEVNKHLFLQHIHEVGGFGQLILDESKPMLVRVQNGIVERAERRDIKLFIQQQVEALPERFSGIDRIDLLNLVLDKNRGLFDAETLDFLPTVAADFIRDSATKAFLFLKNGWVEITATTKEIHPYGTQPGLVWKSHIKPHDYVPLSAESYEQCDFHTFMGKIFGNDPARLRAAQLAQGYLIHNYKEDTNTKAIIHEDKVAGEGQNNGRSGKSLLTIAVSQLRKTAIQDGRQFSFEDNFRWQKIEQDTEVFGFDEWKESLKFESLFSTITGAWAVNKKNQPEFVIPFSRSPKIVISTNNVIVPKDQSSKGRMIKLAVDNYYNADFTPEMDLGKAFWGSAWDEDGAEWNRFINLAIGWVQLFLANNRKLESVELDETKAREFLAQTDEGFPEFLDSMKAAARAERDTAGDGLLCIWLDDAHELFKRDNGLSIGAKDKREFSKYMKKAGCEASRVTTRRSTRYHQMYFTWGEPTE